MIVVCGPIAQSSPIVVSPFRHVPGSIVVSWPIVTSASMQRRRRVDDRDAVAGVARRGCCCWASARTSARSTRSLTPSVSVASVTRWAWTVLPDSMQLRQHVGQVQLALRVVAVDLGQRGEQAAAVERVDAGVDLADRELLGRSRRPRPWPPRPVRRCRCGRGRRARTGAGSSSSIVAIVAAAPLSSCASTRSAIASAVISGTSPESTTTVAPASMCEPAAATASPVPFGSSWTATTTPSGRRSSSRRFGLSTTTTLPGAGLERGGHGPQDQRAPAERVQDLGQRRNACAFLRRRR